MTNGRRLPRCTDGPVATSDAPFTISSISNQYATWDSNVDVALSGSDVTEWGDPIGDYNLTVDSGTPSYTASNSVFGGEPSVDCLFGEALQNVLISHPEVFTLWFIIEFVSVDQETPFRDAGGNSHGIRVDSGVIQALNEVGFDWGTPTNLPSLSTETPYSVICVMNGTSSLWYLDGTLAGLTGPPQGGAPLGGFKFGHATQNESRLRACGIVTGTMSDSDRAGLDSIVAGY